MTVIDKRVYRAERMDFRIRPDQTIRPGDRVILEFGFPYNDILVFRGKCRVVSHYSADIYCIPFLHSGEAAQNTGLYMYHLNHNTAGGSFGTGSDLVLRLYNQWNPQFVHEPGCTIRAHLIVNNNFVQTSKFP